MDTTNGKVPPERLHKKHPQLSQANQSFFLDPQTSVLFHTSLYIWKIRSTKNKGAATKFIVGIHDPSLLDANEWKLIWIFLKENVANTVETLSRIAIRLANDKNLYILLAANNCRLIQKNKRAQMKWCWRNLAPYYQEVYHKAHRKWPAVLRRL